VPSGRGRNYCDGYRNQLSMLKRLGYPHTGVAQTPSPGCPSVRLEPNYVPKPVSAGDNFCVRGKKGPGMVACLRSRVPESSRTRLGPSRGRFPRCSGRSPGRHRISDGVKGLMLLCRKKQSIQSQIFAQPFLEMSTRVVVVMVGQFPRTV
jgi:hypothetical protein